MAKRRLDVSTDTADGQASGSLHSRILESYLAEVNWIHSSDAGVAETSYYAALAKLFDAVGATLKPKVRCILNLKDQGAGLPDGGFFTADQFQRQSDGKPKTGQLPGRGAIEVKGAKPEVANIAQSEQVKGYLARYGIVLVTNLREFLIVERGGNGHSTARESFALADDERDFWRHKAAHPHRTAQEKGKQFFEFIARACLHAAPLTDPKDVAWFLASYARDALFRVEQQKELPALQTVRAALEEALGMKFTDEKGEHFFRSTLVQTLFYGVFSAWVRWHKDNPGSKARFDWRTAEWTLHVPFIRTLYEEVAKPSRLGPLGLVEVLNWAAGVLNRVDRGEFFGRFEDKHAVQYFYEPFLEAYDPELRKELGVWYTPPEIVKYQVARVDRVLREELDLADGLADPNVIVLDPCCGTGAYLVEVLRSIAATLRATRDDGLWANDLKKAAMERVFGFEIMPAPFVVSHLQLGLMLQTEGAPLAHGKNERVGVYLTNALTGWEPPKGPKQQVMSWVELQEERDAAEHVKRDKKILVILGNPPYNGFAGIAIEEERDLSNAYRTTKKAPPPQGQGLNDLYVRFFRMAERRICEMNQPGRGVVCFISNYSWLDGLSFTGMRERYLEAFSRIWIDNLHGDRIISEYAPDGRTSETIFAIGGQSPGIKVGTAITLLVKGSNGGSRLLYRDMNEARADERRMALLAQPDGYTSLTPAVEIGLPFKPSATGDSYFSWPLLPQLLPVSFPGVKTARDRSLVSIDEEALRQRIATYFDADVTDSDAKSVVPDLVEDDARFDAQQTRALLRKRGIHDEGFRHYYYRPFDIRWLYWEPETKLLDEKRAEYVKHVGSNNPCMVLAQRTRKGFYPPVVTSLVVSYHVIESVSLAFPLHLVSEADTLLENAGHKPNIAPAAGAYLASVRGDSRALFFHIVAVLHAPVYCDENAGALRQDWPRVPLPADRKLLEASAALGERIAALLDTEADAPGVTTGKISPLLKTIGLITKTGGGQLDTAGDDLAVTAGWGHAGQGGVTMPGKGKIEPRAYSEAEGKALQAEAAARGMSAEDARRLLGEQTCDVYLNDVAYWRNIPSNVWEYCIGGYQVIKKWLSYREGKLLGRALKSEEAREVMNMARRIAAILLLQPKLDENYREVVAAAYAWRRESEDAKTTE